MKFHKATITLRNLDKCHDVIGKLCRWSISAGKPTSVSGDFDVCFQQNIRQLGIMLQYHNLITRSDQSLHQRGVISIDRLYSYYNNTNVHIYTQRAIKNLTMLLVLIN